MGPYVFERLLGVGGMGEVHLARHRLLDRLVAIKHIRLDVDADLHGRKRLRREARAAARLSHHAVVQIHDLLESDDGDWIVMEYVDGPTLGQVLAQGPLDVGRALELGRQIAEGLAAAHEQGVLHRDLKSDNIMLEGGRADGSWRARILDFGLAKVLWWHDDSQSSSFAHSLTAHGEVMGTCRAMSPEQARGLELDGRSDLFSLGSLLYEMLTAVAPFQAETPVATMTRVASHEPPAPHTLVDTIPGEVSDFLAVLMHKSADERPANGWQVARELERLTRRLALSDSSAPLDGRWAESSSEVTPTLFDRLAPIAVGGGRRPSPSGPGGSAPDAGQAGQWRPAHSPHMRPRPLVRPGDTDGRGYPAGRYWPRSAPQALAVALSALLLLGLVGFLGFRLGQSEPTSAEAASVPGARAHHLPGPPEPGSAASANLPSADQTSSPAAAEAPLHLRRAAALLWSNGQEDLARANLMLAAELLRHDGNDRGLAHVLTDMAVDRSMDQTRALLDEARRAAERSGDTPTRVRVGARLAEHARRHERQDRARRRAMAVLDLVPGTLVVPPRDRTLPSPPSGHQPASLPVTEKATLGDIVLAYLVLAHCDRKGHGADAALRWLDLAEESLLAASDGVAPETEDQLGENDDSALEIERRIRQRLADLFEDSDRPWDASELRRSPA